MSGIQRPTAMVGNDFVLSRPRMQLATPVATPTVLSVPVAVEQTTESIPVTRAAQSQPASRHIFSQVVELLHRNSVIAFALLFLLVGTSGAQVASAYASARISTSVAGVLSANPVAPAITGFNKTVPKDQLAASIQTITNQTAQLTVGDTAVPISPDTIHSWLQITSGQSDAEAHIHVKADAIVSSIQAQAAKLVKTPINQVAISHDNGAPQVIVAGVNGTKLTDPSGLDAQSKALAKSVLDAKGIQLNAPTTVLNFSVVGPTAFAKLLEVNVDTKQMYAYDNGVLTRTFPVSAGAPATPTPIGQYKIFEKLPVQDMRGYNANGTKYFQPNVRWINYFLPGGYAVHGNYWRPQSWFGNINSSHGCVSLPDDQAKWVYDWAPLGTTVITHHS